MSLPAAAGDLRALTAALSQAADQAPQLVGAKVIRQAAEDIEVRAASLAPHRSGRLAESITVVYLGPLTAVIGPSAIYGVFQEFGTGQRGEFPRGPITIRPKNGTGFLRFTVNGKTIYARQVVSPGVPPHPFMRPAFTGEMQMITANVARLGGQLALGRAA